MTPSLRFLSFVFAALLVTRVPGADVPAPPVVLPQMSIAVPVANDFPSPEIVFAIRNTSAQPIEVGRVLTPRSVLVWQGPRGITWQSGGSALHTAKGVPVPAGTEVVIDRFPIKDVYLMIASGADSKGAQLNDGDVFHVTWLVDGSPSNEIILRYSELK